MCLAALYVQVIANYRGIGLADMVAAIRDDRPLRCSGELALHVIDVLTSIMHSADCGEFVTTIAQCERPEAWDDIAANSLMRE